MTLEQSIRSLTPGRARLRHPMLKTLKGEALATFTSTLLAWPGILSAEVNPRVGSLLLTWDKDALTAEELMAAASLFFPEVPDETPVQAPVKPVATLKEAADAGAGMISGALKKAEGLLKEPSGKVLDALAPYVAPDQRRAARRRRVTQNRLMLGALTGSISAIALRSSAHAALGWVFTALLALHLYQHRRVL